MQLQLCHLREEVVKISVSSAFLQQIIATQLALPNASHYKIAIYTSKNMYLKSVNVSRGATNTTLTFLISVPKQQ